MADEKTEWEDVGEDPLKWIDKTMGKEDRKAIKGLEKVVKERDKLLDAIADKTAESKAHIASLKSQLTKDTIDETARLKELDEILIEEKEGLILRFENEKNPLSRVTQCKVGDLVVTVKRPTKVFVPEDSVEDLLIHLMDICKEKLPITEVKWDKKMLRGLIEGGAIPKSLAEIVPDPHIALMLDTGGD